MSLRGKFKSKILNKSDTYNFYKSEYEKSLDKGEKLEKNIQELTEKLKIKERQLKKLNDQFESFDDFLINSYHAPFINAPFSDNFKRHLEFMDSITNKLVSNVKYSDNPLISVIMPVFNREKVVMNAVNSILSQSYQNFELIIVDDGSSDGTIDVLNEINNEKIKLIITGENNGCPAARNRGILESHGEIICYLDSDNLWDKDYLAATVGAYVELPDADCIYSAQMRYKDYDSNPERFLFGSLNKSLLHNVNFIDVNSLTHKRHILNDIIGFDGTLTREEDWDFVLRINSRYKIYSIPFLQSKYFLDVADNRMLNVLESNATTIRKKNFKTNSGHKRTLKCKVTIIIPFISIESNVKKCINSILALELNNLDIIIFNNNDSGIDLTYFDNFNYIKVVDSKLNGSFCDFLVQAIEIADDTSDIIILNQNSILTEGAIELMQEYSQKLSDSGLIVSSQISKNFSRGHVPHASNKYWCDITPSKVCGNILKVPLFYDGEILELSYAPFFCTYIKRNVVNSINFNFKTDDYETMVLLSEYVRLVLNLKVYHVSDVIVFKNQEGLSNEF